MRLTRGFKQLRITFTRLGCLALLLSVVVLITTCMHSLPSHNLSLSIIRQRQKGLSFSGQLKRLEEARRRYPDLVPLTRDVHVILKATEAEYARQYDDAAGLWQEGLGLRSSEFSSDLFRGWLNLYLRDNGSAENLNLLAGLILSETDQGRRSFFLTRKGLTDEAKLAAWLKTWLPGTRTMGSADEVAKSPDDAGLMPPAKPGIPDDDPLLQKTADSYCQAKRKAESWWKAWRESLGGLASAYWDGLVFSCQNKPGLAIQALQSGLAGDVGGKSPAENYLVVAALEKLVVLLRRNDAREEAATRYQSLVNAWKQPGISPSAMGLEPREFLLRRINDTLWAARYRALIGDYHHGRQYTHEASQLIEESRESLPELSLRTAESLSNYQAEAAHILSFRIAMEKREYGHAVAVAREGLEIPHLTKEWKDRFLWYQGLYEYLDGNSDRSWELWQSLRESTSSDSVRYRATFWLSLLAHKKGRTEMSLKLLHELGEESPLDYYYVVAPHLARMPYSDHWQRRFHRPQGLERVLARSRKYDTRRLRAHPGTAPLLAKTEVLLQAGLTGWARPVCDSLATKIAKVIPASGDPDAYLYLSRLLFGSGHYGRAIGMTGLLSRMMKDFWLRHPEQIHVLYPRGYAEIFSEHAGRTGVSPSLLYAITRQESLFKADARSFAGAVGLMQVIPPTALRIADWGGMDLSGRDIHEQLAEAETNIALGSLYLKILKQRYQDHLPAVVASYNAGEYAVDIWLKRRNHPDPLVWIEMIPFGETRAYVQKVLRNKIIYDYLGAGHREVVIRPEQPRILHALLRPDPENKRHR